MLAQHERLLAAVVQLQWVWDVVRGREGGHFRGERGPVQRLRDEARDGTPRRVGMR